MLKNQKTYTKIWLKYQKCKDYMDKKGLVSKTNECWNFYIGKQWEGCETGGERLPVMNFIKPVIKYKTAIVSQNSMVANYSDIENRVENQAIYEALNQNFSKHWEKGKMDSIAWEIINAAAIQGDAYAYWSTEDTLQPPDIIPNTSILFGDENTTRIQEQPFIIIRERLDVKAVREVAKQNKIPKSEQEMIVSDNDTQNTIVNRDEVEDKVTSLLYMEKKDGVVHIARSTAQCIYEPLHPLSGTLTSLRSYPIASMIWEPVPFSARGTSEVAQLIPNQLEVNKTLARRSMTVKLCAYPRLAYDANAINNPEDLDKVGAPIAVNGGNAQSISQMISYLNATNISSDAASLLSDLIKTTRELAGAGDYATGNVNPEQASGTAIIAVRDTAQTPLNEQVARYKQFVEDIALLWFDMWVAYNPMGMTIDVTNEAGEVVPVTLSQEELSSLKPTVRIDVSQDNQWTKLAEQQWLDNMFERQQLTLEEYVELAPDNGTVPKGKARAMLARRQQLQEQQQQAMIQEATQELMARGVPEQDAIAMAQNMSNSGQQAAF